MIVRKYLSQRLRGEWYIIEWNGRSFKAFLKKTHEVIEFHNSIHN